MPGDGIEAHEGLVEHEQVGVVGDRPGEFGPLPHPLGERHEWPPGRVEQSHPFERRVGADGGRRRRESREPNKIRHPLPRR